jgi:hypothetical protein
MKKNLSLIVLITSMLLLTVLVFNTLGSNDTGEYIDDMDMFN